MPPSERAERLKAKGMEKKKNHPKNLGGKDPLRIEKKIARWLTPLGHFSYVRAAVHLRLASTVLTKVNLG